VAALKPDRAAAAASLHDELLGNWWLNFEACLLPCTLSVRCRTDGFTTLGEALGGGTIFKLTAFGILTTLHSFGAMNDGDMPSSLMIAGDGNFYGTTTSGGAGGIGTLFRVTPAGSESVLYSFTGSNGTGPTSLILASDGNFYGLTSNGGVDGLGTIFKAVPH
jgi:uncharacterized repeat protein (TIGR03803 family)